MKTLMLLFFSASRDCYFGQDAFLKAKSSASGAHFFQISNRLVAFGVVDFKEAGNCRWSKSFGGFLRQLFRLFFGFLALSDKWECGLTCFYNWRRDQKHKGYFSYERPNENKRRQRC